LRKAYPNPRYFARSHDVSQHRVDFVAKKIIFAHKNDNWFVSLFLAAIGKFFRKALRETARIIRARSGIASDWQYDKEMNW
jgi:hypothetical protein